MIASLMTPTCRLNVSSTTVSSFPTLPALRLRPPVPCRRGSDQLSIAATPHKFASTLLGKALRPSKSLAASHKGVCNFQLQLGRRGFSLKVQDATCSSNVLSQRIVKAFNRVPHAIVVTGLVAANVAVWYVWKTIAEEPENRGLKKLRIMHLLFVQIGVNLLGSRPWTLLTSCFFHCDIQALIRDMAPILIVAFPVVTIIGNSAFLAIYAAGGVSSRVVRYVQSIFDPECRFLDATKLAMIDSAGAAAALTSVYACFIPFIKLWGGELRVFPVVYILIHGTWCFLCIFTDTGKNFRKEGHAAAAGWLGGTVGGTLFYFVRVRPQLYRRLQYGLRGIS